MLGFKAMLGKAAVGPEVACRYTHSEIRYGGETAVGTIARLVKRTPPILHVADSEALNHCSGSYLSPDLSWSP